MVGLDRPATQRRPIGLHDHWRDRRALGFFGVYNCGGKVEMDKVYCKSAPKDQLASDLRPYTSVVSDVAAVNYRPETNRF